MNRFGNGVGGTGVLLLLAGTLALAGPVEADGGEGGRYDIEHPSYREECGSCHAAYPPQLLPAASWNSLMSGLERHFGSDASLDPATAAGIAGYLVAHAARGDRRDREAPLRISETVWFRREHREGREGIARGAFASPAIGSVANCGACHPGASDGDYREDRVRIPAIAARR